MAYIGQTPSAVPLDGSDIADDIVDSQHYAAGSIDTAHLADDQITLAKMAAGTDGNIISYDASGNPVAIATGSDGQVLTSAGAGAPPAFEAAPVGGQYKLLKGTWDISTTGSLAITGVGFAPKHILFMAAVSGQPTASFGMGDDDGTEWILYNQHENSANDWAVVVDTTIASIPLDSGNKYAYLTVSSYDADGITLSRTKYSTPTGTGHYAITFFG